MHNLYKDKDNFWKNFSKNIKLVPKYNKSMFCVKCKGTGVIHPDGITEIKCKHGR